MLRWLVPFVVLCVSSPALADEKGAAAAELLFREGRALLQKGDLPAACDKLGRSQSLDPAHGTLALLAYCNEQRGRTATAWRQYVDAARLAKEAGKKDQAKAAEKRAEALEGKLSKLKIEIVDRPDGFVVKRNGEIVPDAELGVAVPVDPGEVSIDATAPGREPFHQSFELASGSSDGVVQVPSLSRMKSEGAVPTDEPRQTRTSSDRPERERSWLSENAVGVGLVGVGVVGLGVGTFFGLSAKKKNDDSEQHCNSDNRCDDRGLSLRDDALTASYVSTTGFAVGLVAGGIGTVMLITSSSKSKKTAVRIAPFGVGLAVGGSL